MNKKGKFFDVSSHFQEKIGKTTWMCVEFVVSDVSFVFYCAFITNSKYNTSSFGHLILFALNCITLGILSLQFSLNISNYHNELVSKV